jgi:hypothetical protein
MATALIDKVAPLPRRAGKSVAKALKYIAYVIEAGGTYVMFPTNIPGASFTQEDREDYELAYSICQNLKLGIEFRESTLSAKSNIIKR